MINNKLPAEYFFKEGCFIQELHNSSIDESMSIARVRVEPNQITKLHSLNGTTERYAILSGKGEVTVGDEWWLVGKGDVTVIEPGIAQKIRNTGDQDLVFLAICTPRFVPENYIQLED